MILKACNDNFVGNRFFTVSQVSLYADLSSVDGISIADLREAFSRQPRR